MNPHQHAHHWITTSRHTTSEGPIWYERCQCGQWRVRRETSVQLDQTLVLTPARSA